MKTMEISCIQCGTAFEFSIDEQIRHIKLNYDKPRRCRSCRKKKVKIRDEQNTRNNHKKRHVPLDLDD
jgi:hypothetical protein